MIDFTEEIHAEARITPAEEVTLGSKTQELIRLETLYSDLEAELNRKPTDDEWCSAAGKINMTCLKQCIEEGKAAKDKLVVSNLRMVQRVVNLYIRNGLGSEYNAGDMMQEGTLVRNPLFNKRSILLLSYKLSHIYITGTDSSC